MRYIPLRPELEADAAMIRTWARSTPEVRNARLFGSRTRGEHRQDSDLDVAVALYGDYQEVLTTSIWEFSGWREELETLLGKTIDLQLADHRQCPRVWEFLQAGCVMVFRRRRQK